MNGRASVAGTARGVRMTAVGLGALTVVASAAISGCSGSGSTSSPIFSPTVTSTASVSVTASVVSPSSGVTSTDTATATITPTPTTTITPTVTVTPTPTTTVTVYPSAAPVTGGGGTAGLQDAALFGIGGAAVLLGAGTLAYRRRTSRRR